MLKLKVPNMTCGHCAEVVMKVVQSIDVGAKVDIDLKTQTLTIDANSVAVPSHRHLKWRAILPPSAPRDNDGLSRGGVSLRPKRGMINSESKVGT